MVNKTLMVKMMGTLNYDRAGGVLELVMKPKFSDLFGEVVMSRFDSLAKALNCEARLTVG